MLGLFCKEILGFEVLPPPETRWDHYWQVLPLEMMQSDLLYSLWHFHAQPPLFNLYGGIIVKLFGVNHLSVLYLGNILFGALLSGIIYILLTHFIQNRAVAFRVAFVLALSPTLLLYEPYMLYTIITAFWAAVSVLLLLFHYNTQKERYLILFILCANVLILTRGVYHLTFLGIAIPFAVILSRYSWKRMVVICLLVSMVSIGWYAKNQAQFGFFGASSWSGQNIWNIVYKGYNHNQLQKLAEENVIDPMVARLYYPFHKPSTYQLYGFNKQSNIEILARDDMNNINIIDISNAYQDNAIRLIKHDPLRYVHTIARAYRLFTKPSSSTTQDAHPPNASRIQWYEAFYADILQGAFFARWFTGRDFGPFLFILLPLSISFYIGNFIRRLFAQPQHWLQLLRADGPFFYAVMLVLYTTVIANVVEFEENDRFTVLVEQIMWIVIFTIFYRFFAKKSLLQEKV